VIAVAVLGLAFEVSRALRSEVLCFTNQSQRALICAALGAPVRMGGMATGAALAAVATKLAATSSEATDLRMESLR